MNIYEKLCLVQSELKAPKGQFNSFGKYKYRNLEDICEAIKPLLLKHKLTLFITDEPTMTGDRVYICASATLVDNEKPEDKIKTMAFARESLTKKGMDDSQITGATSSYARKYCLNGLFCIDDTKDADSMDNKKTDTKPAPKQDDTTRYLNKLKELKKDYPTQVKEVETHWEMDLKNVTNFESQKGIIIEITEKLGTKS